MRDVFLLYRKQTTSNAYWTDWTRLPHQLSGKFYRVMEAIGAALETVRGFHRGVYLLSFFSIGEYGSDITPKHRSEERRPSR